jgi:hypothetical protein
MTRDRLILHISQAHVAPGMSLLRWQEIVTRHTQYPGTAGAGGLALTDDPAAWDAVSDAGVKAMVEEIAAVIGAAKQLNALDLVERIER